MTQYNPTRRPVSRAATAIAALGAAASLALATPGAANAAIAIPEVPEWVTQILPTPDQVKDGSASTDRRRTLLDGGDRLRLLAGDVVRRMTGADDVRVDLTWEDLVTPAPV